MSLSIGKLCLRYSSVLFENSGATSFQILIEIKKYILHLWFYNGCISISAFDCLVDIPMGVTSSAIGLKDCTIALVQCLQFVHKLKYLS